MTDSIKQMIMKPEFPIVQIEIKNWNLNLMIELFRFDEFYYSNDDNFYYDYIHEKKFLDSNGRIFLARERVKVKSFWSKLGIGKKYRIIYNETKEQWNFDEVKNFLISKVNKLPFQEGRNEWLNSLERAKTIKQLIEAER